MGLFERIQAKIELFRLERRYTRRRQTFVSNAIYVDGEYVYQTPTSTGSSTNTSTVNDMHTTAPDKAGRRLSRFSSMPGFGSVSKAGGQGAVQDWREDHRTGASDVR